jgi:hypothetical protein
MPAKGDFKLKVLIGGDKKALEAAHVNDPSKPTRISNDVRLRNYSRMLIARSLRETYSCVSKALMPPT